MTQAERDRLVALKKAKKKVITQREALAKGIFQNSSRCFTLDAGKGHGSPTSQDSPLRSANNCSESGVSFPMNLLSEAGEVDAACVCT